MGFDRILDTILSGKFEMNGSECPVAKILVYKIVNEFLPIRLPFAIRHSNFPLKAFIRQQPLSSDVRASSVPVFLQPQLQEWLLPQPLPLQP